MVLLSRKIKKQTLWANKKQNGIQYNYLRHAYERLELLLVTSQGDRTFKVHLGFPSHLSLFKSCKIISQPQKSFLSDSLCQSKVMPELHYAIITLSCGQKYFCQKKEFVSFSDARIRLCDNHASLWAKIFLSESLCQSKVMPELHYATMTLSCGQKQFCQKAGALV